MHNHQATSSDDGPLIAFLAERDQPCPACGYNLRGLRSARCPECDSHLALRVGEARRREGAFIAGLTGCSAGLGFCLLVLGIGATQGLSQQEAAPLVVGALAGIVLYTIWILERDRIRRRRQLFMWIAAGVFTAGALAGPAWFLMRVL